MNSRLKRCISLTSLAVCLAWSGHGFAQETPAPRPVGRTSSEAAGEIIVMARKREESLLNVPVIESVVPREKLERLQTTEMSDIARLTPGLLFSGRGQVSVGTQVTLRGVGTTATDPGVDQSVSLNLDGLALGQGLAFQSGLFDMQQIEVLKGPQALFYGKSSPGGVISIRTADPTDRLEVVARASYDFESVEKRGELILSGPLSDTFKVRLASMVSGARGWFLDTPTLFPGTGAALPPYTHGPRDNRYVIRGTVLWNPSSEFDARLKVNVTRAKTLFSEAEQAVSCPDGTASPSGINFMGTDCTLDRHSDLVAYDPSFFPGVVNNGVPFIENKQLYGTLEMNYHARPDITVTSLTGYYRLRSQSLTNTTASTSAAPILAVDNHFYRRDFTQELRVNSDFSTPVNFTAGAFYQDGRLTNLIRFGGNAAFFLPPLLSLDQIAIDIKSYSAFGQLRWNVVPQLEIAGGVRWTRETRTETLFNFVTNTATISGVPRISSSNFSPEFTLTYKPNTNLTIFASAKQAYKSGSFNAATLPLAGQANNFGDEKVQGVELGLKSRMLDGQLLFNAAAYYYKYKDLQVGAIVPTVGTIPRLRTVNAASAKVRGVDVDMSYRPRDVEGLSINAGLQYNKARFGTFLNAPCYYGQTISQGCNQTPDPTGNVDPATGRPLFLTQTLTGTSLVRAPDWTVNFGFDYTMPVGGGMKLTFSSSNNYQSKYRTALSTLGDANTQRGIIKADLSLALQGPRDLWEVALIGKNVTNKITVGSCDNGDIQNGFIVPTITGGVAPGAGGTSETGCFPDSPRAVIVRLTLRPFN